MGLRDIKIVDGKGGIVFEQSGVECPENWSDTACSIFTSKYFYGKDLQRETSIFQVIDRVVDRIVEWGYDTGYFKTHNKREEFQFNLKNLLIEQKATFNSPVFFNLNTPRKQFSSACFILSVEDNIESIVRWWNDETFIFNSGSGAGINVSTLRSKKERLSGGGWSSGPLSFQRGADTIASVIKSAGRVRRAAKLVVMNDDHPDIGDFIQCKIDAEKQLEVLKNAGIIKGLDDDSAGVPYQSSNHSISITDRFMNAVSYDQEWPLYFVNSPGEISEVASASELFDKMIDAIWLVGDPGAIFTDTVNKWSTVKNDGKINSSNPCIRKGSKIFTKLGWKRIEDLENQEIELFDGVRFVGGRVWRTGKKEVIRLHINNGRTIDLTKDHKVYTEKGWIEAKNTQGLKVPNVELIHSNNYNYNNLPVSIRGGNGFSYQSPVPDLMEALGFFFGDGGIVKNTGEVYICFTEEKDKEFIEQKVIPVFSNIAANYLEEDYKPRLEKYTYKFCRDKLTNWLYKLGFNSNNLPNKTFPEFIFSLSQKAQAHFLRGLFAANGSILNGSHSSITLTSTCKKMLQEVQLLLQVMGISGGVWIHGKEKEHTWPDGKVYIDKESYYYKITHQSDIYLFNKLIGFPQKIQHNKLLNILNLDRFGDKDRSYNKKLDNLEVIKVEDLNIEDEVFDFSCPTTNMGLVNGILVHNCGEFLFLDNSACNLAVLKLTSFFDSKAKTFDIDGFCCAVNIMITAQDILIDNSDFPTEKIKENSMKYRPLGLGYTDLGALLMKMGYSYDSDEGRYIAASIASLMTASAYRQSWRLAKTKGPFEAFEKNKDCMKEVLRKHKDKAWNVDRLNKYSYIMDEALSLWEDLMDEEAEFRNSQVTLMAPNGTSGMCIDSDTLGIEPEFSLVRYKKMAGGGELKIVNDSIKESLENLGYSEDYIAIIEDHIKNGWLLEDCGHLKKEHFSIFDCALPMKQGGCCLSPESHIKMIAAIQPHISSGISKTCNLPSDITREEIKKLVFMAWELGVKGLTFYRDGCKVYQPLTTQKEEDKEEKKEACPIRKKLSSDCNSKRHKFRIGEIEGYLHCGLYEDGSLGEVFITISKEGSTIAGLMDTIATLTSLAIQYKVPLDTLVNKFSYVRFEPSGFTDNPNIKIATSVVDYVFRYLGENFGNRNIENEFSRVSVVPLEDKQENKINASETAKMTYSAPLCSKCGGFLRRNGSCYVCETCGLTTGCS